MSSMRRTISRAISRKNGSFKFSQHRRPNHASGRMRPVAPKKGWTPEWLRRMLQSGWEAGE